MPNNLEPGIVVNSRYRIIRFLGSGAFGAVYLGKDLKEKGLICALKEVRIKDFPAEERKEIIESFHNEARILSNLSHKGIPRIIDFFFKDGKGFLVMERVEGITLEEILINNKNNPLPERDVLQWALQIAETINYLHLQKPPIIYRDLKPSNIMLSIDQRIVLIDFGIARLYNPTRFCDTIPLGTPGYSPPEQYGKDQTTPASDIYSLGTTLYYLLTSKDMASFSFNHPPVRTFNHCVSKEFEQVLKKCMEIKQENRYGNIEELKNNLAAILNSIYHMGTLKKLWNSLKKTIKIKV